MSVVCECGVPEQRHRDEDGRWLPCDVLPVIVDTRSRLGELFRRTDGYSEPVPEPAEETMEPVQLTQVRECHFKAKLCELCGESKAHRNHSPKKTATCSGKWPRGCVRCGRNKNDPAHFGAPPSFNSLGIGRGSEGAASHVGAGLLQQWRSLFAVRLADSGLPKGLDRVYVEGEVTFPDASARDQGNFRTIVEKALGDVLKTDGYIADDSWEQFEFGPLYRRVVEGESATRLIIFPNHPTRAPLAPFVHENEQFTLDS